MFVYSKAIGVKQGCGLSPLLFNIFINKLPEIYDKSCDPVKLGSLNLNSLLWADDLVILSTSGKGLQQAIETRLRSKVFSLRRLWNAFWLIFF